MKAKLNLIWSSDVDFLETWTPPGDFSVVLRLEVGPDEGQGEESFDLTVCTGGWLARQAREAGMIDGRHHLIVATFDWARIRSYIQERVDACTGDSWDEIATQLSRFAHWEFEDYDVDPFAD